MSAHTLMQWKVIGFGKRIDDSDDNTICNMTSDFDKERTIAHARLIAAAPELLEALEAVSLDVAAKHLRADVWVQVENVVKKARGE